MLNVVFALDGVSDVIKSSEIDQLLQSVPLSHAAILQDVDGRDKRGHDEFGRVA
jgi:hypothetical protein